MRLLHRFFSMLLNARKFFKVDAAVLILLTSAFAKRIRVYENYDPGKCSNSTRGTLVLVRDREKKDSLLVCTEDNGVYRWKTTDGSKPLGEFFKPGYDCLDILNKNPKAKDGFYWVDFHGPVAKRVWCDMTTDNGGYMLIGHINNTETWSVPSSKDTVEPFGPSQWSSTFGDIPVLDFRIQVATEDNFKSTKAHWSFRLNKRRPLKRLMVQNEFGCGDNSPGIGNIAYVKDLQTEEVVTRRFKCSRFGGYRHPLAKVGWNMMNSCLEKPCSPGFAYHSKFPVQIDYSGGFSFQASGNISTGGSTAFFGCDKNKCCACYGPVGGRDDYCGNECQVKTGGTITKKASAWFWVRSNPAQKIWEKCMEYKVEEDDGKFVWYKLQGDTQVPRKGRCGKHETILNDGIVVVADVAAARNIPPVTGLLAYQKDNQKLYVRTEASWNVLVQEEKMSRKLQKINEVLHNLTQQVSNGTKDSESSKSSMGSKGSRGNPGKSCKDILSSRKTAASTVYWIHPRLFRGKPFQVYCDMNTHGGGWTLVYSYTFTKYNSFTSGSNAVTPRPNWPVSSANVPISTTPPLSESSHGSVDFNFWNEIGKDIMIKSNINHWIVCQPNGGSIVLAKSGSLKCQNIKNVATKCQGHSPGEIQWYGSGPSLDGSSHSYYFDADTGGNWPTHDPCGNNQQNQKKGVTNPGGAIFIR